MYMEVPTYKDGEWSSTEFDSENDYTEFVLSVFKEPGNYEFDETALLFNEQAQNFNKWGYYCNK
ncbi:unnamed protein product, partial [marine sediment metagenome]